jgi:hypothetical protein
VGWNRPGKPRNVIQAVLMGRGTLGGGGEWLKDLVDDGSEERWTIFIEERISSVDTLSTKQGED